MVAKNPLFLTWSAKKFQSTVINDIWPEVIFFTLVATSAYSLPNLPMYIEGTQLTASYYQWCLWCRRRPVTRSQYRTSCWRSWELRWGSSYHSERPLLMTGTSLQSQYYVTTYLRRPLHRYWEGRKLWTVINLVSRNLALLVRILLFRLIVGTNASIRYGFMFQSKEKTKRGKRKMSRSLRRIKMKSPGRQDWKPSSRRRLW